MVINSFTPSTVTVESHPRYDIRTNIKILSNAAPSEIYPTLKINPGDIKIIIECAILYRKKKGYYFTDGRKCADVSSSQAFGLLLHKLSPPKTRDGCENADVYFHSVPAIFTPISKDFFKTPPS